MADDTTETTDEERFIRPFADFLLDHRHGYLASELSSALNDLIVGVHENKKSGTLTLTLKVKPGVKGSTRSMIVADEIKLSLPKPEAGEALYYATDDGNLTREDPDQQKFNLRDVSAPEDDEHIREARP